MRKELKRMRAYSVKEESVNDPRFVCLSRVMENIILNGGLMEDINLCANPAGYSNEQLGEVSISYKGFCFLIHKEECTMMDIVNFDEDSEMKMSHQAAIYTAGSLAQADKYARAYNYTQQRDIEGETDYVHYLLDTIGEAFGDKSNEIEKELLGK